MMVTGAAPDPGDAPDLWGGEPDADESAVEMRVTGGWVPGVTRHHDRVLAVLLVYGLESDCRAHAGGRGYTSSVADLAARVTRVQAQLCAVRSPATGCHPSGNSASVDSGSDADGWLLAVYDAALAQLCDAVGVCHSLVDDNVCSEAERLRVELALLPSVLPLE
jgi:hypothetical protein